MSGGKVKVQPQQQQQQQPVSPDQPAAKRSKFAQLGRLLEYAAWAALFGGAAVAISADGLGLADFHVVPENLRPAFQALLQQKAVRVEELLAHHDPSPEGEVPVLPSVDTITLGPWDAQSTYIQASPQP